MTDQDQTTASPEPEAQVASTPDVATTDEVAAKLGEYDVAGDVIAKVKDELGATTVSDLASLTEGDLVAAGMKPIPARKLVAALAPAPAVAEATASAMGSAAFDDMLPTVPSESSWLEQLKAGGVSKVDQSTVISAVRAALAHRAGLFNIPGLLVTEMEKFADANEEQVDPEYFKLRKMLTQRSYAEIFSAIEGLDGNYVTEARKKELFARIDRALWPAINEFHGQVKSWQEAWMGSANPMAMMAMVMTSGSGASAMPPGMMQPPDTGVLHDHADAVADAINKVFAGTGVQIAAALAYDATKINETLQNPRLPSLIGAANRDQMLRQLGVAVSATYPRLETNLTRYVLATMQVKDQPAGNEELSYFGALFMLGSQIPWDQLGGTGKVSGIGGRPL